jgi:hypothetical protein
MEELRWENIKTLGCNMRLYHRAEKRWKMFRFAIISARSSKLLNLLEFDMIKVRDWKKDKRIKEKIENIIRLCSIMSEKNN